MVKSDKPKVEDVIKIAKLLRKKVSILCRRGACEWCPLDNIEDCNNYIQLSQMKYHKDLDQYY
ncbi:hypothetical protein G8V07_12530 [Clostridium botulinum D/C]|uniref:hypothetical protein n=1 Tax=Clostridium botulinum TaxID=1491 RepID=UPI001E34F234|nr:hypothetical protein [Clostridium botulinum]MCD3321135.1 hypothetical protein [Clostridium botulinum D/C]MCD3324575.1 hypothetical protein [Clostridium botulinum D/C]MCD3326859.1 hypothetical protein [Clostridium botulinum D/C]